MHLSIAHTYCTYLSHIYIVHMYNIYLQHVCATSRYTRYTSTVFSIDISARLSASRKCQTECNCSSHSFAGRVWEWTAPTTWLLLRCLHCCRACWLLPQRGWLLLRLWCCLLCWLLLRQLSCLLCSGLRSCPSGFSVLQPMSCHRPYCAYGRIRTIL